MTVEGVLAAQAPIASDPLRCAGTSGPEGTTRGKVVRSRSRSRLSGASGAAAELAEDVPGRGPMPVSLAPAAAHRHQAAPRASPRPPARPGQNQVEQARAGCRSLSRAKNPVIAGITTRKDSKPAVRQGISLASAWLAPGETARPDILRWTSPSGTGWWAGRSRSSAGERSLARARLAWSRNAGLVLPPVRDLRVRAALDHPGPSGPRRILDRPAELRRPGRGQRDGLVHLPPGRGRTGARSDQESRSTTVWPGLAFRWKAGMTPSP